MTSTVYMLLHDTVSVWTSKDVLRTFYKFYLAPRARALNDGGSLSYPAIGFVPTGEAFTLTLLEGLAPYMGRPIADEAEMDFIRDFFKDKSMTFWYRDRSAAVLNPESSKVAIRSLKRGLMMIRRHGSTKRQTRI